jgi:hypothetical protein
MAQAKLKEVLTGPQGLKYGALVKIALPGDDETLLRFSQDLLDELRLKPIYRRDMVVVRPVMVTPGMKTGGRIEPMTASSFRTFVDHYVAVFKQKYDEKGEPFDVVRSINKETAQGVLDCDDFWSGLREIVTVNPVPMLSADEEGNVTLLQPGYDEKTKTLTFG